jgi:signal transduction histidine kinase
MKTLRHTEFERRVSTRAWTIAVLLAVIVMLTTAQYLVGRSWYAQGFDEAERADLLMRARHAQVIVDTARKSLLSTAADYAVWDATVTYARGGEPDYATNNWQFKTLDRFAIDAVVIVNAADRVLLAREVDRAARGERTLAAVHPIVRSVSPGGQVRDLTSSEGEASGYTVVGQGAFIWASTPVRLSGDTGPIHGYVWLFRSLGADFNAMAGTAAGASLQFERELGGRAVARMPLNPADLRYDLSTARAATVNFIIESLPDGSRLRATVAAPRPLLGTVRRLSQYTLLTNLAIGALLAILAVTMLHHRLLRPLENLVRRLGDIGARDDSAMRIDVPARNDEIAAVIQAVNTMLATIASKRDAETARDAAIEANRLKSEFLAVMSHEIRTPMNGVLGMLELLSRSSLDEQQHDRLQIASNSATSLLELLNSILDLSRLEAGRMELEIQPVDIRNLIAKVCELFEPRAAEKGLWLRSELPPGLAEAYKVDGGKLRQILGNLVGNAVKFTERGGITVRVSCGASGREGQQLDIEVADTGIGIAPGQLGAVFEPFVQEHGGIARRYGGSGLGLSISKRLADLLGFSLAVRSVVDSGTCFTLSALLETAAVERRAAQPERLQRLGLHVLVAEDNDVNRALICAVLDMLGCTYQLSRDGREAVTAFQALAPRFDAVLMDLNMPHLDGLEATRQIRALEARVPGGGAARVPIIGVTASAMAGDRELCLQAGMDDHVAKPYRIEELRAVLQSWRSTACHNLQGSLVG